MPRQDHREPWPYAGSTQLLHFFSDFGLDLRGDLVTVKNGASHGIHGNNYLNHKKCKGTPGAGAIRIVL
jgi:hypothetical protein